MIWKKYSAEYRDCRVQTMFVAGVAATWLTAPIVDLIASLNASKF